MIWVSRVVASRVLVEFWWGSSRKKLVEMHGKRFPESRGAAVFSYASQAKCPWTAHARTHGAMRLPGQSHMAMFYVLCSVTCVASSEETADTSKHGNELCVADSLLVEVSLSCFAPPAL